jgi:hypothetical protein
MNIAINIFTVLLKDLRMCQRGNCQFSNLKIQKSIKVESLHKDTAEIETRMTEKSSPGSRQRDGEYLVWFGEIARKLPKLSMPTFSYRSSSKLFYGPGIRRQETRLGLENRKKIGQIINEDHCLLFSLLFILCIQPLSYI